MALDQLGNSGNENGGWDVTGVTTTLTTLSADDVDANLEALLNVLGVTDHVHGEYTGFVKSVNDGLGRDTDSRHKEFGTALDNDVNKLIELALGVIVAIA